MTKKELIENLQGRKWACEYCNHVYTKKELEFLISNDKNNQICPKCKALNS